MEIKRDLYIEQLKIRKDNVVSGMESLTELYKIGRGPSSSHTIGPEKACLIFKKRYDILV